MRGPEPFRPRLTRTASTKNCFTVFESSGKKRIIRTSVTTATLKGPSGPATRTFRPVIGSTSTLIGTSGRRKKRNDLRHWLLWFGGSNKTKKQNRRKQRKQTLEPAVFLFSVFSVSSCSIFFKVVCRACKRRASLLAGRQKALSRFYSTNLPLNHSRLAFPSSCSRELFLILDLQFAF